MATWAYPPLPQAQLNREADSALVRNSRALAGKYYPRTPQFQYRPQQKKEEKEKEKKKRIALHDPSGVHAPTPVFLGS